MIKFRAYVSNDVNIPAGMYRVIKMVFEPEMTIYIQLDNVVQKVSGEFELMQFTGYTDRNDREIYLGDKLEYVFPYDKKSVHVAEVFLSDNFAGYSVKGPKGNLLPLQKESATKFATIVGSVYGEKN